MKLRTLSNTLSKGALSPSQQEEENKFLSSPGDKIDFMTPERKRDGVGQTQR